MPYILVEIVDEGGNKELIAAPETWLERDDRDSQAFLCWPIVRNITTLNALLADASSTPLPGWEKHPCVIKCSNIQSLAIAGKMIDTLQKHWKDYGGGASKNSNRPGDASNGSSWKVKQENGFRDGNQTGARPEDEPDEEELTGMLVELTRKIESSNDAVRKRLYDGFRRVEKCLDELAEESLPTPSSNTSNPRKPSAQAWSPPHSAFEFYVNPLTCIEEMNDFEERLYDDEYRTQVHRWIDYTIGHERKPVKRMVEILDALIDIAFLAKFTWTGRSRMGKFAMVDYANIVDLFQYAGTTQTHLATPRFVAEFFSRKLNHLSAAKLRQAQQMRNLPTGDKNPTCTEEDDESTQTSATPSFTLEYEDSSIAETSTLDTIATKDDNAESSAPSSPPLPASHSSSTPPVPQTAQKMQPKKLTTSSEIIIDRFNTIEELDAFEEQLNDPEIRVRVHRWASETVGYESDPDRRMMEMLDLLFDRHFLPKFTWRGRREGSYALFKYSNILRLFQYVATSATHLADPLYVEKFLSNKLRHASVRAELYKGLRKSVPRKRRLV
uniref:DUF4806 domain-containing protein n=1 Tax=Anopheles melas TaxID=34690 RepID=A0A182TW27_9DIPT